MSIKYKSAWAASENTGSTKPYFDQFEKPERLEVGKVYHQENIGEWASCDYKIIFIGEGVALGISINSRISKDCNGEKELFYSEGNAIGFKYGDIDRPCYRLIEKEK